MLKLQGIESAAVKGQRSRRLASRAALPIVAAGFTAAASWMLLSAKRSLLLLPPEAPPGAAGENLALLKAAAERLRVPMVSPQSANWRVGLAMGRNQLVAAGPLSEAEMKGLPPGTRIFQVIDCLADDRRPPEAAWNDAEVTPVATEMVVFEWLERGATEAFRDLIKLIK